VVISAELQEQLLEVPAEPWWPLALGPWVALLSVLKAVPVRELQSVVLLGEPSVESSGASYVLRVAAPVSGAISGKINKQTALRMKPRD
jgi:hypothetical protein